MGEAHNKLSNIKYKKMATLNTYLNFNGNTEEAFNFYKSVFGGEFKTLQRFKDTPDADKIPANAQDENYACCFTSRRQCSDGD